MRVSLPHTLGREEVRRRMHMQAHRIAGFFPAGMATVETDWPSEDHMSLIVVALGQRITGGVDVLDEEVVIEMDLPAALGLVRGMIERSVRKEGGKLLDSD